MLRTATKSLGHAVGVRGTRPSQRYTLISPDHCVVDTVAPEVIAGVRGWPTRDIAALQGFREVRAPLNHLALPWGPIGSVGFAAFGSSRYLVVAADSASAAILAGGLSPIASIGRVW